MNLMNLKWFQNVSAFLRLTVEAPKPEQIEQSRILLNSPSLVLEPKELYLQWLWGIIYTFSVWILVWSSKLDNRFITHATHSGLLRSLPNFAIYFAFQLSTAAQNMYLSRVEELAPLWLFLFSLLLSLLLYHEHYRAEETYSMCADGHALSLQNCCLFLSSC